MHKRFLPENYKYDLYLRVLSLDQGRMSVKEYFHEFKKLQICSGLDEEPEKTVVRFLRGLDPRIAEKVNL